MADPGFMDRGADILLPPPAPPLLLSSLLLPFIPPLFFLDVQACRGAGAPPAPTLDPPLCTRIWGMKIYVLTKNKKIKCVIN